MCMCVERVGISIQREGENIYITTKRGERKRDSGESKRGGGSRISQAGNV